MPPLRPLYRVTVYVPRDAFDAVLEAAHDALPPTGFAYDRLAWWCDATEQFRPLPGSNPTQGQVGRIERSASIRLELSIDRDETVLAVLLTAIAEAHPWEEPAVFVEQAFAPAGRRS
jgi:hypothetical protein